MKNLWEYDGGLFQSKEPVFVASVGDKYDAWYNVGDDQTPSAKQIAAWEKFCGLRPCDLTKQFSIVLDDFADKMNALPKEAPPKFGHSYYSKALGKSAKEAALFLHSTNLPLGEVKPSVFRCDSLVIPLQEYAPCRFILMNFELKQGEALGQPYGYEMEALFCDEQLLLIGENSGLWTRLEWEKEFNILDFDKKSVRSIYWQL